MEYVVTYSVNKTDEDAYLANYDVIMESAGGLRLGHSGRYIGEDRQIHMLVRKWSLGLVSQLIKGWMIIAISGDKKNVVPYRQKSFHQAI